MTGKRIVTLDRLTLHLPPHAARDPKAIVEAVSRAVAETAGASAERLSVVAGPSPASEGSQALAQRIGRITAARLRSGGGS